MAEITRERAAELVMNTNPYLGEELWESGHILHNEDHPVHQFLQKEGVTLPPNFTLTKFDGEVLGLAAIGIGSVETTRILNSKYMSMLKTVYDERPDKGELSPHMQIKKSTIDVYFEGITGARRRETAGVVNWKYRYNALSDLAAGRPLGVTRSGLMSRVAYLLANDIAKGSTIGEYAVSNTSTSLVGELTTVMALDMQEYARKELQEVMLGTAYAYEGSEDTKPYRDQIEKGILFAEAPQTFFGRFSSQLNANIAALWYEKFAQARDSGLPETELAENGYFNPSNPQYVEEAIKVYLRGKFQDTDFPYPYKWEDASPEATTRAWFNEHVMKGYPGERYPTISGRIIHLSVNRPINRVPQEVIIENLDELIAAS